MPVGEEREAAAPACSKQAPEEDHVEDHQDDDHADALLVHPDLAFLLAADDDDWAWPRMAQRRSGSTYPVQRPCCATRKS
jgi:hypothetical protein